MAETPENQNAPSTLQPEDPCVETIIEPTEDLSPQDPMPSIQEQLSFEPSESKDPEKQPDPDRQESALFEADKFYPTPSLTLSSSGQGHQQKAKSSKVMMVALLSICLLAGSFIGYATIYSTLNGKIDNLQAQLQLYQSSIQNGNNGNSNEVPSANPSPEVSLNVNVPDPSPSANNQDSLANVYQNVKDAVVVVQCLVQRYTLWGFPAGYSNQQGSGFVTSVNGQQVIVTNNHVINTGVNITVTFSDGSSYAATVLGADAYADLAVLKADFIPRGTPSLAFNSSSNLNIGDTVIAVGSPYGLSDTLTTGIISALGRTIVEQVGNNEIAIPDVIQTSTQINPGNSGGPLINLQGQVIGMTTATISNSQGLCFAIPSDTITREISDLVNNGKYTKHPSLNAVGTDMNLQIAQAMNVDVTSGWLVQIAPENSGLKGGTTQTTVLGNRIIIGGDIIIGVGNTVITNGDALLAYLERNTLPGQRVNFTIIRDGQQQTVTVEIGSLN